MSNGAMAYGAPPWDPNDLRPDQVRPVVPLVEPNPLDAFRVLERDPQTLSVNARIDEDGKLHVIISVDGALVAQLSGSGDVSFKGEL